MMDRRQTITPYPEVPPPGYCSILTSFDLEYHENHIPAGKAEQAIEYGERIYSGFENTQHCLGAIMLLLSDIPAEPLISTQQAQKASVLGLTTLGFVLSDPDHAAIARRIVLNSDGIIILRLSGELEKSKYQIETFEGRDSYTEHLKSLINKRSMQQGKNSTLL